MINIKELNLLSLISRQSLNGEDTLTCSLLKQDAPLDLQIETKLEFNNHVYTVKNLIERQDDVGIPFLDIYAENVWYNLAFSEEIKPKIFDEASAKDVLAYALKHTDWQIDKVEPIAKRSLEVIETNALELIQTVRQLYGGELIFDDFNKKVSLVHQRGKDRGLFFSFSKNLQSIEKEIDSSNLITKLYAVGRDGLTFASINDGKPYLEDYSYSKDTRIKILNLESFTSQKQMLDYSKMQLAKLSKPRVTYRMNVVDLSFLTDYQHEFFELGDIVKIYDEALKINLQTRIVTIEKDILHPENTKLELSTRTRNLANRDTIHEREQVVKDKHNEERLLALRENQQKVLTDYKAWRSAQADLTDLMSKSQGYYTTTKVDRNGAITSYVHDKPELVDSTFIMKKNAYGESYSNDGGQTWNSGRDADGNLLAKTISTIGLRAEWIHVGDDPLSEVLAKLKINTGAEQVIQQRNAPSPAKASMLWLDLSQSPPQLKRYTGSTWEKLADVIKPKSIGTTELKDNAVGTGNIANGAVSNTKIQDNAISSVKIQSNAITSTKITGGAITTPKLATNAVTSDKILAGAITADKIQAGAITTEKLSVLAFNLVNNFSVTGSKDGWTKDITLINAPELDNTPFCFIKTDKGKFFQSDLFFVDPKKSYKFSMSVRSPQKGVNIFFGVSCFNKEGKEINLLLPDGKEAGKGTQYFYSTSSSIPSWQHMEAYVLGSYESSRGIPKSKNINKNFKWPKNAYQAKIVCWHTCQALTESYWWGPSVTDVNAGEIQASRITTGRLQSTNNVSWLDLDNGRFSFASGALSYDGDSLKIKGEIKSIHGGRTAEISNGQLMISRGSQEILNISNFIEPGQDAYIVLGSGSNNLHIAKSAYKGSVTDTFMTFTNYGSYLNIMLNAPIEYPSGYMFGKIQISDVQGGGLALLVNNRGIILGAGRNGAQVYNNGYVTDL